VSTDSDLIRHSRDAPEAFAGIFDRHAPEIYRYAARRVGDFAAADVMSETFLIAFERRGAFDHSWHDARPWLYGIATNILRGHRRGEARLLKALARTGEPREAGTDPSDAAVARVDAERAHRSVADALRHLSQADRETLLLFAWGDLGYEAIAAALGIPVGTVRSRLNRARRLLRDRLGPDAARYNDIIDDTDPEEDHGRAGTAPQPAG
jgi:RNA polymerase sigma-70 factor (ECF subfamily)